MQSLHGGNGSGLPAIVEHVVDPKAVSWPIVAALALLHMCFLYFVQASPPLWIGVLLEVNSGL